MLNGRGGEFITKGTTWLGWLSLLIGLGLIGFAFWRRMGKKDSAPRMKLQQPSTNRLPSIQGKPQTVMTHNEQIIITTELTSHRPLQGKER
ncbi:MAG: hypothetical protein R2851_23875 [Caldilineaceae bacterium]